MISTLQPPSAAPDARRRGGPAAVELKSVSVTYQKTVALADFSLRVERGETVALLGPSGSGKSTALKAIAGFEQPSAGSIHLDGADVTGSAPAQRNLGVVVQSYALFPHMRVDANVAYGLKARRLPRAQVAARVTEMLEMVGMAAHAHKFPRQLSGGQQQRIAIARALAIRPAVLLLDEPLSALDAQLRQDMLAELQALRTELPDIAMVYVTHDQSEALTLADRIAVMRDSRLVEIGTADELYSRPRSEFTAAFLGGASLLPAIVQAHGGQADADADADAGSLSLATVSVGEHRLEVSATSVLSVGQQVSVAVRPHAWQLTGGPLREAVGVRKNHLPARVDSVQWRGAGHRMRVDLIGTGQQVSVDVPALAAVPAVGDLVVLRVDPAHAVAITGGQSA